MTTTQSARLPASAVPDSARWLVVAAAAAGLAYPALDGRFGLPADVVLKGLGVGLLALTAVLRRRPWLAAIMAAGAAGDMLLAVPGLFIAGAAAFAIGHVIASIFYLRHRRPGIGSGDRVAAAALIAYGLVMPQLVLPEGAPTGGPMLYAVLLSIMAAAALLSRFARPWTGIGVLLFVVSDTLLILRLGGTLVGGATLHGLLVWYSYFAGQLLIFTGIAAAPARDGTLAS